LFGTAASWPIVEIGPKGPLLLSVTPGHGVDARDLLALAPLLAAISVALPLLGRPQRKGMKRRQRQVVAAAVTARARYAELDE
jgi:hypothetical protein